MQPFHNLFRGRASKRLKSSAAKSCESWCYEATSRDLLTKMTKAVKCPQSSKPSLFHPKPVSKVEGPMFTSPKTEIKTFLQISNIIKIAKVSARIGWCNFSKAFSNWASALWKIVSTWSYLITCISVSHDMVSISAYPTNPGAPLEKDCHCAVV